MLYEVITGEHGLAARRQPQNLEAVRRERGEDVGGSPVLDRRHRQRRADRNADRLAVEGIAAIGIEDHQIDTERGGVAVSYNFV